MVIGVLKEPNIKRVALTPALVKKLIDLGAAVHIESGAGADAFFPDASYEEVGATISTASGILGAVDLLISVEPLPLEQYDALSPGTNVLSAFQPYNDPEITKALEQRQLTAFSLDMVPRSTRAQRMDLLSSMANVAGYRSVLSAAQHLPRFFPMMITAAGSIRPAKVLVLGAGVAGLQAIATARRLGAMVEASDVRQAAKEEVLSLGAKFVEVEGAVEDTGAGGYAVEQSEDYLERQRAEVQRRAADADVVITTAQVRGRKAPLLLPAATVEQMRAGSVVVDLASSTGGNCELSQDSQIVQQHGVTIIGNSALADTMPQDASTLFANNAFHFCQLIIKDGALHLPLEDDIVEAALITPAPATVPNSEN